jgi:hypothetical protein
MSGVLPCVMGILDSTGARVDVPDVDGTYKPIILKLGAGLVGTNRINGGVNEVTITAAAGGEPPVSGTITTNASAIVSIPLYSFTAGMIGAAHFRGAVTVASSAAGGKPFTILVGASCTAAGVVTVESDGGATPATPYAEVVGSGLDVNLMLHGDGGTDVWWVYIDIVASEVTP